MSSRIAVSCSSLGLRIEPRSPPVQVTTRTRCPSATYLAIVAAPLLDSSSGCACTAMRRSCSLTVSLLCSGRPCFSPAPPPRSNALPPRGGGTMDGVTTDDADARAALADRYGLTTDAATRRRRRVLLLVLAAV